MKELLNADKKKSSAILSNFKKLDGIMGEMRCGEMIVPAALPSACKITFGSDVAKNVVTTKSCLDVVLRYKNDGSATVPALVWHPACLIFIRSRFAFVDAQQFIAVRV